MTDELQEKAQHPDPAHDLRQYAAEHGLTVVERVHWTTDGVGQISSDPSPKDD